MLAKVDSGHVIKISLRRFLINNEAPLHTLDTVLYAYFNDCKIKLHHS